MATIAEIATTDDRFNVLTNALIFIDSEIADANLVATLSDPTVDLTVFAPTDEAFGQLALDLGFDGDAADEAAVTGFLATTLGAEGLLDVVLYHVAPEGQTRAELNAAGTIDTLNGATIESDGPTLVDGEPDLIDPSIVQADIAADNGIIQAIDRVLLPDDLEGNDAPTIAGIVAASGEFDDNGSDFDLLLASLAAAGLVETFEGEGDFTVFAPNDAAFLALAETLGFEGIGEADAFDFIVEALTLLGGGDPIPLLTQILTYHVAPESLQASQVLEADTIATLETSEITVNGTALGDLDPGLADPNLIATDIPASNGIVHVIDGVLLPLEVSAILGRFGDIEVGTDERDVFITGAGDDFIGAGGGSDLVFAGSGNDTVDGGNGNDLLTLGLGDDTANGGAGADLINARGGNDTVNGGEGHDTIFGGAGDDMLDGGEGDDFIFVRLGADTVIATEGMDRDFVFGFEADRDQIDVSALGIETFADLTIVQSLDDTQIDFGDGDSITLVDVTAADLDADDFIFATTTAADMPFV